MNLDDPSSISLISSLITAFVGSITLFFRWLSRNFHKLEERMDYIAKAGEKRHEENLYRFERISVALARLGSTNGITKDDILRH